MLLKRGVIVKKIYVPYTYVDSNGNIIHTMREAKEFSFFKKIKIFILTIMFPITKNRKKLDNISGIKKYNR